MRFEEKDRNTVTTDAGMSLIAAAFPVLTTAGYLLPIQAVPFMRLLAGMLTLLSAR
jgi:hypothetical protein